MGDRSRPALFWLAMVMAWWTALVPLEILNEKVFLADARGTEFDLADSLVLHVANAWVVRVPLSLLALWLAARWPVGRNRRQNIVVHLAGFAVSAVYVTLCTVALHDRVGWLDTLPPLGVLFLGEALWILYFYVLLTLGAHGIHFARQHRRQTAELARAELRMLQAQMRPHFLFNSLNTIASLIPERPATAEATIARLGVLLRRSLEGEGAVEISLAEELGLVRAYVDIERARFPDRLFVDWEIEPEAEDAQIPSLLLQPLVENAVRHGLLPRTQGGRLAVAAWRQGDHLVLQVRDDGAGLPARAADGIGLKNIRARLAQLYGSRHAFTLEPGAGGGTTATVRLPYRSEDR